MWVKRVVPFVITLTLGLFIASFFISLTMPKLRFERRQQQYKRHCNLESRWMKAERQALEAEREALRRERSIFRQEQQFTVETPVFTPPAEPTVPRGEYGEGRAVKR